MKTTEYGRMMQDYRKKAGLTQADLAYALGFTSAQFISNLERGICKLPIRHIPKAAKLLKVPEKTLIEAHLKIVHDETLIRMRSSRRRGKQ